jgi:hypothetical protein
VEGRRDRWSLMKAKVLTVESVDCPPTLEQGCRTGRAASQVENKGQTFKDVGTGSGSDLATWVLVPTVTGRRNVMMYESIQPAETGSDSALEHLTYSAYLFCLAEDMNNPILSLDSRYHIAFLLHHVLGYRIEDAAFLTQLSEEEFRSDLLISYWPDANLVPMCI